jgi:hypothetical protein
MSPLQNGNHYSSSSLSLNSAGRGDLWIFRSPIWILAIFSIVFVICSRTIIWNSQQDQPEQHRIGGEAFPQQVFHGEFTLSTDTNEERLNELSKLQSFYSSRNDNDSSSSDSGSTDVLRDSESRSSSGEFDDDTAISERFIRRRQYHSPKEFALSAAANEARLDALAEALKVATDDDDKIDSRSTSLSTSRDEESYSTEYERSDDDEAVEKEEADGIESTKDEADTSEEGEIQDEHSTELISKESVDDVDNRAIDADDDEEVSGEGSGEKEDSNGTNSNDSESSDKEEDGESDDDTTTQSSESRKELGRSIVTDRSKENSENVEKLCTRQDIIDGKWVKDVLSKPPYVVSTVHLRCYPRETYYDKKNGWSTWKWLPQRKEDGQCTFESHFNKDDFCNLLPSGIVSIVGDSLSWEHYRSLVQLSGLNTHQGYQHQSRELNTNIFQSVCDHKTKILYRRDDKLQNVTGSILQDFPTVLVLNRGAHWVPDDELIGDIRKNIAELKEHWIPKCIENRMKCHFFWRTAVPGHPFCYEKTKEKDKHGEAVNVPTYKEPINDLAFWENLIGNLSIYNNRSINFHWYDYQPQNKLVLAELDKAFGVLNATSPYFTYEIIDAYYLNIRRPDEHRAHQVSFSITP